LPPHAKPILGHMPLITRPLITRRGAAASCLNRAYAQFRRDQSEKLMKHQDIGNPAPCCATALRQASRRLTQLYDEALAPSGLRSTQLAILSALPQGGKEGPTLSDLARALVLDRSALGHNLRPLERDGLIRIEAGRDDRRQRRVYLTPQGRRACKTAGKLWSVAQQRFLSVFGAERASLLRDALIEIAHDDRLASVTDAEADPR
jgi:DNA-binding MarR family transcriptional regulator